MTTVALITDANTFALKTADTPPIPSGEETIRSGMDDFNNIRARLTEHALAINANEPRGGTWTPGFSAFDANLTFTLVGNALYTRNQNILCAYFQVTIALVVPGSYATNFTLTGLPFAQPGGAALPIVTGMWAQGSPGTPMPGLFPIAASGTQVSFNGGLTDQVQVLNACVTCQVVP